MLELEGVEDKELLAAALVQPWPAHDTEHRVGLWLEVLGLEVELLEGIFQRRVELAFAGLAAEHLLQRVSGDVNLGEHLRRWFSLSALLLRERNLAVFVELALHRGHRDSHVAEHLLSPLVLDGRNVGVGGVDELAVQLLAAGKEGDSSGGRCNLTSARMCASGVP